MLWRGINVRSAEHDILTFFCVEDWKLRPELKQYRRTSETILSRSHFLECVCSANIMPPQHPPPNKSPQILDLFQHLLKNTGVWKWPKKNLIYLGLILLLQSHLVFPFIFINFPRFPQVLKNLSFNLGSLGPNPAKHLSTGIAPLHSLFILVFCKNRILIPIRNKGRLSLRLKGKKTDTFVAGCF